MCDYRRKAYFLHITGGGAVEGLQDGEGFIK